MNPQVVDVMAEVLFWTGTGLWWPWFFIRRMSPRPPIYWPLNRIVGPLMFVAGFLRTLAADSWPDKIFTAGLTDHPVLDVDGPRRP